MNTNFKVPSFQHYKVQERMMRVGIESRGSTDVNEIFQSAIKSLREDFQRRDKAINVYQLASLFEKQSRHGIYYFITEVDGRFQIMKFHDFSELDEYSHGTLKENHTIPILYR